MTDGLSALALAEQVDAICDRFEREFREGQGPRIENLLAPTPGSLRSSLLHGLIALEVELRQQQGEHPLFDEYMQRFPADVEAVTQAFSDLVSVLSSVKATTADTSRGEVPSPAGSSIREPLNELGRFQIVSLLGEGAFGRVYKAHDPQLDRLVAIKVPRAGSLQTSEDRDRFLREARSAAGLQHPQICPVHEVGTVDGRDHIVMAFIDGKPLSKVLQSQSNLSDKQIVNVVRKIARGLQEAHEKGVVHRDLKPANIMINRKGEPVIMDFGLARRAKATDPQISHSGQILGTPAYMSPEQARGGGKSVGPAADIYSLGVIMYEMLCGRRPFEGTVTEVIGQILHVDVTPPSSHRTEVNPRLESICLKAIAKDPAARHASMKQLADELDDFLRSGSTVNSPALATVDAIAALETKPVQHGFDDARSDLRTIVQHVAEPQRAPLRNLWRTTLIGSGLAGALVLFGIVFFMANRTVKVSVTLDHIDVNDPQLGFHLDGKNIHRSRLIGEVELTPGKHELIVMKDNQVYRRYELNAIRGKESAQVLVKESAPEPVPELAGSRRVDVRELNFTSYATSPWLSGDGLTMYLEARKPDETTEIGPWIWSARRPDADAPFDDKQALFPGRLPTLTGDGLEMIFVRGQKEGGALRVARRSSLNEALIPFGPIAELADQDNVKSPCLSPDGLTLVFQRGRDHNSTIELVFSTRPDRKSPWNRPKALPMSPDPTSTEPATSPFLSQDGLTLWYCRGAGTALAPEVRKATRPDRNSPFGDHQPVIVEGKPLVGRSPRFVEPTRELFYSQNPTEIPGNWSLWVVKDYHPLPPRSSASPRKLGNYADYAPGSWTRLWDSESAIKRALVQGTYGDDAVLQNGTLTVRNRSVLRGPVPVPNVAIRMKLQYERRAECFMNFRSDLAANGTHYTNWINGSTGFGLGRHDSGKFTEIGGRVGLPNLKEGQFYEWLGVADGNSFAIFINGELALKMEDAAIDSGYFALVVWDGKATIKDAEYRLLDADRAFAEWVFRQKGSANIETPQGEFRTDVKETSSLPNGNFLVREFTIDRPMPLDKSGLELLEQLTGLKGFGIEHNDLTDEDILRLGRMPMARRIVSVDFHGKNLTDAGLESLAGWSNLQDLNFGQTQATWSGLDRLRGLKLKKLLPTGSPFGDAALEQVHHFPDLEHIDLADTKVTDASMVHLTKLPKLEGLVLYNTAITDAGLKSLHDVQRTLRRLWLRKTKVTAAGVAAFLAARPEVTIDADVEPYPERAIAEWILSAGGAVRVAQASALPNDLAEYMQLPFLTRVDQLPGGTWHVVGITSAATDENAARLAGLKHLKLLWLLGPSLTDAGLAHLAGHRELVALLMQSRNLTDTGIEHLRGMTQLEELNIGDSRLTDDGLAHFAAMSNLRRLDLYRTNVSGVGLPKLKPLANLRQLNLSECQGVNDDNLRRVTELTQLTGLYLNSTAITDAGIRHVAQLRSLKSLEISGTKITGACLDELVALPDLGYLMLNDTSIGDVDAAKLPQLKSLHALHCLGSRIGDEGLKPIGTMLPLKHLVLSQTRVTDAGMAHLEPLQKLEMLWLWDNQLTDAAVDSLGKLKSVGHLDIGKTSITPEGRKRLQTLLPKTRITPELGADRAAMDASQVDPDRRAAEWVRRHGTGVVRLKRSGEEVPVNSATELPKEPFHLIVLDLWGKPFIPEEMENLRGLKHLVRVVLHGCQSVDDRGLAILGEIPSITMLAIGNNIFTGEGLSSLAGLKQLTELNIGENPHIDDRSLRHLNALPHLNFLGIAQTSITDEGIRQISQMPRLRSLSIGSNRITSAALDHLADLPALTSLDARNTGLADSDGPKIGRLKSLTVLHLTGTNLGDAGLQSISTLDRVTNLFASETPLTNEGLKSIGQMRGLRELWLGNIRQMDDAGVAHLTSLENLRELHLSRNHISDACVNDLGKMKSLVHLMLHQTQITSVGLQRLEELLPKTKIDWSPAAAAANASERATAAWVIRNGGGVRTAAGKEQPVIRQLDQLPPGDFKVTGIFLGDGREPKRTNIYDADLRHFSGLTDLKELELGLEGVQVTGSGIEHLVGLKNLEKLHFYYCPLRDEGLVHVGQMTWLKSLRADATFITDRGLAHLKGLTELRAVNIGFNGITGNGLKHLTGLTKLELLNVYGTKFTDNDFTQLVPLSALHTLHVGHNHHSHFNGSGLVQLRPLRSLREVALHDSDVTDDGLRGLAALEGIETVHLGQTKVTDEGLKHLHGLKTLRRLNLSGAAVTDAGVQQLKAALPDCEISR